MSAQWLDSSLPSARSTIVKWALDNVGVYEMPPGSNRSGIIDAWNKAAAAPMGSPWCASFVRDGWLAGGITPLGNAACEDWHQNAIRTGRFTGSPVPGDVVLYSFGGGAADHCGIVVRVTPTVLTVEGNTNEAGGREGVGVFLKDRDGVGVIGYVSAT